MGNDEIHDDRRPIHVNNGQHRDISKQRQRQQPKQPRVLVVLDEDLEDDQDRGNGDEEWDEGDGDDEPEGGHHGAQVRPDIEGVGPGDEDGSHVHHRSRETLFDERRQAFPAGESEAGRELLDCRGERERYRNRPQHRETKLGSELRVGADSRGIVVGGPRDQSRADVAQKAEPATPSTSGVHQPMASAGVTSAVPGLKAV